ncbi:mitochondrial ribosomal protein [Lodderomyces elongisporus]|uniref:mitochondrial ribosomal protein n=1 Tax=Lodderomyces elongisporus TaxID=36914 RepID=UPI00291C81C1|nr:mitochondrial ribosomal protein [Lodderomyces elongisporus]WLF80556.1 mitochondrial ribosomal protein [Lodderomyces elongisporus]
MSNAEDRIARLEALVEKQSKLIATTGQRLLELQVHDVKSKMSQISSSEGQSSKLDSDEFITNEDVVQLVTELQTQLDFLEDRSMRRTHNSTLKEDTEKLAPLSNRDGDFPEFSIPITFGDFKALSKEGVLRMGLFFEIILPSEGEISETLSKSTDTKNDLINLAKNKDISELMNNFDDEQVDDVYDELARYFGIKHRRRADGW